MHQMYFLYHQEHLSRFYLFLTLLNLRCVGYSLVVVCRCLTVAAPLVAEHRLRGAWASVVVARGLSICGSQSLDPRLNSCVSEA